VHNIDEFKQRLLEMHGMQQTVIDSTIITIGVIGLTCVYWRRVDMNGALNLQDRKMTDDITRGGKCGTGN